MLKKVLVTLGLLFLLILSGKATETIVPRLSPLPATIQGQKISLNVKLLKLYLAIENTLYLCIKDKINNEKSYRLYSCFY